MKRLTQKQLRDRQIFNEYGLAELQDEPRVWVSFTPRGDSGSMTVSGWRVHRVGWHTDGTLKESKGFINQGQHDKEVKRLEAMAWASEKYNFHEWERSPFGSYHPVGTLARAATP